MKKYSSVDEFIADAPPQGQTLLLQIVKIIKQTIPKIEETFSYSVPTYKLNGKTIIHIGSYKNHVALYPGPAVVETLLSKLKSLKTSKGTIQFPLDQPLPVSLVEQIVKSSLDINTAK